MKSMTSFTKKEIKTDKYILALEIRTVNYRYLEAELNLPEICGHLEPELRKILHKYISRGKINCKLSCTLIDNSKTVDINNLLFSRILKAVVKTQKIFNLSHSKGIDVGDIIKIPGVLRILPKKVSIHAFNKAILELFKKTLTNLCLSKEREGKYLGKKIFQRINKIYLLIKKMKKQKPKLDSLLRKRITLKTGKFLSEETQKQKLDQELSLIIQKNDISEEIDRLEIHSNEIIRILNKNESSPIGKQIDFYMQEIIRETNTINSKIPYPYITKIAINIKLYSEQIREQIQNIE